MYVHNAYEPELRKRFLVHLRETNISTAYLKFYDIILDVTVLVSQMEKAWIVIAFSI